MSMFDDIETIWRYGAPAEPRIDVEEAIDRLVDLSEQFNALATDWADAPEWAEWSVIHANGLQYWYDTEPFASDGAIGWNWRGLQNDFYRELTLPLGIDWRLCKWQRPA